MKKIDNYHIYLNGKTLHMTRKEFINYLIKLNQVKHYDTMNKRFKKETNKDELPTLYKTKAGYVYAVLP